MRWDREVGPSTQSLGRAVPVETRGISSPCFLVLPPFVSFWHNVFCFSVPFGGPSVCPAWGRVDTEISTSSAAAGPGQSLGSGPGPRSPWAPASSRWTLPAGPRCLEVRPDMGQGRRHVTDCPTVCQDACRAGTKDLVDLAWPGGPYGFTNSKVPNGAV